MQVVELGRTGLQVSVAGLGCGGHSRLGQSYGATEQDSMAVVRAAVDAGVTLIDTAQLYGTEPIVGRALEGRRDDVVLSTKAPPFEGDKPVSARRFRKGVEESLKALRTDRVDLFFLHGVLLPHLDHVRSTLVPELLALRDAGQIRHLAVSEAFMSDRGHAALGQLLADGDDWFDVAMVGHTLLNPSARERVLGPTRERGIGVLGMFAVRKALASAEGILRVTDKLVGRGELPAGAIDRDDPLGFLVHDGGAASVVEAAYRFARHEPGIDVVLTGTGNVAHLTENLRSIAAGPLPDQDLAQLERLFGKVDSVTGD